MEERVWRIRNRFKPKRKSMEAMSRREKILKWMLVLSALLSAALLPMQGQKQGSDYMLHGGDGGIQPYKYNGKELDRMHGLEWYDYGARMYNGYRFTTPDPLSERYYSTSPYAYCLNNPVIHVDRDGRAVETVWDVASLAMGVSSFTENLRQGNVGAAVADGFGIIVDGFAVATPFVPGGAGAAIKAARAADRATDALQAAGKIDDVSKTSRAARREVMREQGKHRPWQPSSVH